MGIYVWLALVFAFAIEIHAADNEFRETVDFTANVMDKAKNKESKQLRAEIYVKLNGNVNHISITSLEDHILTDTEDEWMGFMFDDNVEDALQSVSTFKITKTGKILFQRREFDQKETSWSIALKRAILNLFIFEVDKNGDGYTKVKVNLEKMNDFSELKFVIPNYRSSIAKESKKTSKNLRTRTKKPKYTDLLTSKIGETEICTVKQYDKESDPLRRRKISQRMPYDADAESNGPIEVPITYFMTIKK